MATNIAARYLEISSLKARIKLLKDKDKGTTKLSRDDAPIKGRSLETGEEAGVERSTKRGSNDTEELLNVLTSMDAANILTSGVANVSVPHAAEVSTVGVPTGSGVVPTGSGLVPTVSVIFTTASMVTPYSRRKGKEKMVESDTPKKKKLDDEIARIHAEEELQMMIYGLDRNSEVIAKHLQEYEQSEAGLTIGKKIDLINEVKENQEKDKIGSKPDKNGKRGEAGKSQKQIMSSITAQQTKLHLELVPNEKRLKIGKCNRRLNPRKIQREPTFQVVLDALALTPCYFAFLITTDVPEVKRFKLTLEIFKDIFKICPRVQGQDFDALPTDEEIVSFLRKLSHLGEINSLNMVIVDQMHQPWRTFAALINRSLYGKTTGLDKLCLSKVQIL
nr:hypothetical protein [Tanacetum cinerariifolium]